MLLASFQQKSRVSKILKPSFKHSDEQPWPFLLLHLKSTLVRTFEGGPTMIWWKPSRTCSGTDFYQTNNIALTTISCSTLQSIQHFIEHTQMSRFGRISFVSMRRKFKRFREMVADVAGRLDVCLVYPANSLSLTIVVRVTPVVAAKQE